MKRVVMISHSMYYADEHTFSHEGVRKEKMMTSSMKPEALKGLRRQAMLLIAVILLFSPVTVCCASSASYVYDFRSDGTCEVRILISNTTDKDIVYVSLEPSVISESIIVLGGDGKLLPFDLVNQTLLEVVTGGGVDSVYVSYEAVLGEVAGDIVNATVHPEGPSVIRLPPGSGILYFNGTPSINIVDNRFVLSYKEPGAYLIEFIVPPTAPPTTPTTTTTATIPATATTTSVPVTTTTTPTKTVTPTTPAATTTTVTTITTPVTTVTETTTTPSATTPALTERKWSLPVILGVVVVAVAVIALLFARSRGKSRAASGNTLAVTTSVSVENELDDRDVMLLKVLREGEETISSLSRKTGLSKSVVWRRVQKLIRLGLVEREDRGGSTYLRITREGERKLGK